MLAGDTKPLRGFRNTPAPDFPAEELRQSHSNLALTCHICRARDCRATEPRAVMAQAEAWP